MKKLSSIVLAALAITGAAHADSNVAVKNDTGRVIRVYWSALGCAGAKDGRGLVCSWKILPPGVTVSYKFRPGTSNPQVTFFDPPCDDVKEADSWNARERNTVRNCTVYH